MTGGRAAAAGTAAARGGGAARGRGGKTAPKAAPKRKQPDVPLKPAAVTSGGQRPTPPLTLQARQALQPSVKNHSRGEVLGPPTTAF